jgi:predicted phage replisome organizer
MKRYYWLKLKRDFFKRHDITVIESMPNGEKYLLFYLKLLLESVDHDGALRFSDTVPYNDTMLSAITRTDIDTVRGAVKLFESLGMMDILDDGTLYMKQVEAMTGAETDWAEKKRLYRHDHPQIADMSETMSGQKRTMSDKRLEIRDKSIENRDKIKDKEEEKRPCGVQFSFIQDDNWRELFTTWARNKKNPYRKQIGAEKGFAHLQSLSQNNLDIARQIVDNSLANNWTGLFAVKGNERSDQPTINPYAVELAEKLRRNGN